MAYLYMTRTIASISTCLYVLYVVVTSPTIRATILSTFSPVNYPIRFLALLSAILLNAKSLPTIWHFRLFSTMIYQLRFQPKPLPKDALLRPLIKTGFHSPLPQCDYNGHKSNSTYFADADIARTALVSCLLRKGINGMWSKDGVSLKETSGAIDAKPARGLYTVALGGVSCTFKREIKPYERYEIWTRVLSWDRKWIYFISHFVKAGVVKPDEFALQPWLEGGRKNATDKAGEVRARWTKAVFATSIAKYVVKKGRQTTPPETIFRTNELFPLTPEDAGYAEWRKAVVSEGVERWDVELVEGERKRGLKLVEAAQTGEGLLEEFPMAPVMLTLKEKTKKEIEIGKAGKGNGHCEVIAQEQFVGPVRVLGRYRDWTLSL